MKRSDAENIVIKARLKAALSEMSIGQTINYDDLSKIAGRDITAQRDRWLLNSARELAEREHGCFFECVRGIGIKRLSHHSAPDVGFTGINSATRKLRKTKKRLDRINGNLSEAEQRTVIAQKAMIGSMLTLGKEKTIKRFSDTVDIAKPIPPKDALKMFE